MILKMIIISTILGLLIKMSASDPRRGDLRVYHGEIDSKNQFPFVVTLELAKVYLKICTGSLLAQNWVLTANHCVYSYSPSVIVIRYGDHTRPANETNLFKKVIKIYMHQHYRSSSISFNDIALLLVEKVPKQEHVKLLAVDYKTLFGLPVTYAGFGFTSKEVNPKDHISQITKDRLIPLQVGEGVVVPCKDSHAKGSLRYSAVCVMPKCSKRRQQARQGDSGGPLLYDGRLVGVTRSVDEDLPITEYTPVSPFLEWIRNTMQSNGN